MLRLGITSENRVELQTYLTDSLFETVCTVDKVGLHIKGMHILFMADSTVRVTSNLQNLSNSEEFRC